MYLTLSHPYHGEEMTLTINEILTITTKHRRTVQRWCLHPETVDSDSLKLLQLYAFGLIPSTNPQWKNFNVRADTLYNYDQKRFAVSVHEMGNLWLTYQQNRELRRCVRELKAAAATVKPDKPTAIIYNFTDFLNQSSG